MIQCIDLKQRFGDEYRVRHEDSREKRLGHDPWHYVIACEHGELYPHGNDMLGAATKKHGVIAKRLAALPCVKVTQDGDDGINAIFDVDDLSVVAAIMKPKRRYRLSPERRAECTERLRRYKAEASQNRTSRASESLPAA